MSDPKDQPAAMDLLKTVPLFASLEKKYLKTLAATAADQRYKAGDVLIAEGQKGIGFYLIAEGQVNVEKVGEPVGPSARGNFSGKWHSWTKSPGPRPSRPSARPVAWSSPRGSFGGPRPRGTRPF